MAFRSLSHLPPVQALPDTADVPSGLSGSVDFAHDFHRLIASLYRLHRSGVHPFAGLLMVCLHNKFSSQWPNIRAKRETAAGQQSQAGKNVLCTAKSSMVACRFRLKG